MKNRIIYTNEQEVRHVIQRAQQDKNVWLVEIQGERINTEEEYVFTMNRKFLCPPLEFYKMGWYLDDIRRLLWISQNEIVVVFHNFEKMMLDNLKLKNEIIKDFEEIVLPWWDGEVVGHMVGGEPRKFTVFVSVGDM